MTSAQVHTVALDRWLIVQAVAWIVVISAVLLWVEDAGLVTDQFALWGITALTSYVALVWVLGAGRSVADVVTLTRAALLLGCSGFAWVQGEIGWLVWTGLGIALLGDLVDGWCARRYGPTAAGAMLDMETDQLATLCLAFLLHGVVGVGAWVCLLPGFRYLYVLLLRGAGVSARDPKPCDGDNRRAKTICAAMMILLFLGLTPSISLSVSSLCAAISVAMLAYSYGSDVRFIFQRRSSGLS